MKAILMLKEMPKSCKECPLMFENDDGQWCGYERTGKNELHMKVHYYVGDRTKPNWCQMIEINDNIAKLIEVAR